MKKIVIFILIFVVNSLWAKDPFSKIKDINKIIELANNTDLLIEGKIIGIETVYQNKKEDHIISKDDLSIENIGNILVVTKFKVKILETYKNNLNESRNIIELWVMGGFFFVDEVKYYQYTPDYSSANLSIGDVLILGLNKNDNIRSNIFNTGYKLYNNSSVLQIPSSSSLIREIENGELEKAKRRAYKQKLKSLEESNSNTYPSYDELEQNLLNASIQINKNIEVKKQFIKKLKIALRREYE